ncbi:hypothetical protein CHU95_06495 [Niveispirillum lacus]|uniref:Methylaspartate ammonia-lyase n=1 Tax=Niveispirillum lacus TaxID=1981099 RepID=A0A255Z375_9PROT|nr:hypothetical protein [Niveispirillum lacus]OYQ35906.1 hypothetical protein CHU95_06495 [Niveispirillum lacus]
MMRVLFTPLLAAILTLPAPAGAQAERQPSAVSAATLLESRLCGSLTVAIDSVPGKGPAFLRSFDHPSGAGAPVEDALKNAAFTYDNALAAIALVACGRATKARRIGDALLSAVENDRAGPQGRLRTTYRAGPQQEFPIPPNGWWNQKAQRWEEDAYQVGTATGNVAWAGLALLTLADALNEPKYRAGAAKLGAWVLAHMRDTKGPGGFTGGIHGDGMGTQALTWKSVEHNTDLVALFGWLERAGVPGGDWAAGKAAALGFLNALWRADAGYFPTGTLPDGVTVNDGNSGLDALLWPLLLPESPHDWRRALDRADQVHGVAGGYDFNGDRDGVWVEGTAQAALSWAAVRDQERSVRLLSGLVGDISPGGYLWATRGDKVSTGFAIGPDSKGADFFYYRQPHLGATAWAVLAATGWNPFTGRVVTAP